MNFIKRITKSGVTLYVLPMPAANTVASGVLVNVGSRDEIMPHEAGLAHGFEHMFLRGTKEFPNKKLLSPPSRRNYSMRQHLTPPSTILTVNFFGAIRLSLPQPKIRFPRL